VIRSSARAALPVREAGPILAGMLTLSLLRHAKSSWADADLADCERPLAKRGIKAAPLMGAVMKREDLMPDLVLCSPAARARQTLELVLAEIGGRPPEIEVADAFYPGSPTAMLERLRRIGKRYHHVLVIGHNPGLHALALDLVGKGDRAMLAQLGKKFPTAALAVLRLPGDRWSGLKRGAARLDRFVTPRSLA
jgi:phosphohistidine phosphatase